MCFGGGGSFQARSPESFYDEIKVDYGPLPSLGMAGDKVERGSRLSDVDKRGLPRRSLLNPVQGQSNV